MGLHVLLVEDDPGTARLVRALVNDRDDIVMTHVARLQDALGALQSLAVDAILVDLTLPDSTGFETFSRVKTAAGHAAVIVLTDAESEDIATRALREGAQDCLPRDDIDRPLLRRAIRHAIERRRFEKALIRSEARYRALFEGSIQGIVIHRHGVVLLANKAMAQLVGAASADELIGTEIWAHILPDDRPAVARMIRLRDEGHPMPARFEFRARRRDGSVIWLECVVSKVTWDDEPAVLSTVIDVTERHEQPLAVQDQPSAVVSPPASESLTGTETVLVVEDEENVRAAICQALRRHGYTVLEAASASEAFVRVRDHDEPIDLLLTDVELGGMSGPAMAEGLAAKQPSLRTVFISGHADDAIAQHGIAGSDVRFVRKPFSAESLLREIREALDADA